LALCRYPDQGQADQPGEQEQEVEEAPEAQVSADVAPMQSNPVHRGLSVEGEAGNNADGHRNAGPHPHQAGIEAVLCKMWLPANQALISLKLTQGCAPCP
jgi:hypothetical protein